MNESITAIVGLDVGDKFSEVCILGLDGEVESRTQVRSSQAALTRLFETAEPYRIALEVGSHSRWISQLLKSFGHEVIVANARKLRAIYQSDSKSLSSHT